jgi:hypothetical protein
MISNEQRSPMPLQQDFRMLITWFAYIFVLICFHVYCNKRLSFNKIVWYCMRKNRIKIYWSEIFFWSFYWDQHDGAIICDFDTPVLKNEVFCVHWSYSSFEGTSGPLASELWSSEWSSRQWAVKPLSKYSAAVQKINLQPTVN